MKNKNIKNKKLFNNWKLNIVGQKLKNKKLNKNLKLTMLLSILKKLKKIMIFLQLKEKNLMATNLQMRQ